jgi:hypothetical protein
MMFRPIIVFAVIIVILVIFHRPVTKIISAFIKNLFR